MVQMSLVFKQQMFFKVCFIFSSGCHFVQWSIIVWAILAEESCDVWLKSEVKKRKSLKGITIFSSGCHFVQQSRMVGVILVKGNPRNNPMNFDWNWPGGYREDGLKF